MQQAGGRKIGWVSAAAIVVANMVGTGVFTSLGLQLQGLSSAWAILLLWMIGGMVSLFGAFSYAELGTKLPRSGGEYYFLSRIYHPFIGYLSGWVSLTVGFAASVALAAMAMGAYIGKFSPFSAQAVAIGAIALISMVHSVNIRQSSNFQNTFTALKLLLILFFIIACFALPTESGVGAAELSRAWHADLSKPAFAVSMVYVIYAFSGWNAAAYIVEEIREPARNLPRALIGGTLAVSLLYVLLQMAFLNQASTAQLKGKIEVGQVVAELMFGPAGGQLISFFIALFLISSISAMVWVGPRVVRAMANDYSIWRFLAEDNRHGIPVKAVWLQAGISIFMIVTSSFEQVLLYSGFVLQLFTTAAVAGIFVMRWKNGHSGYSSPGYPWVQVAFLAISIWILAFLLYDRPMESLLGLANLGLGAISYWWSKQHSHRFEES
ncbi:MAG: amino acid permease [Lewinellaceae bacterium]|nr:amino acid permease [Lewinellaceae bacterium]